MTAFWLQGLVLGATYALLAFGFALVYATTRVFHFVHGAVYAAAAYIAWLACDRGLPFAAAAPAGVAAAVLLGWLAEVMLYRPLRRRRSPTDVLFLTSLGAFTVAANALALAFGHEAHPLGLPNPTLAVAGDVRLSVAQIGAVLAAGAAFVLAWWILTRTGFGLRLRAYAANPQLAVALGVDEDRLLAQGAALASGLAGLAAVCVAADVGASPEMGLDAVVIGAVAVVVGGVGSLPGTALAGLLLGILRRLTGYWLGNEWEEAVTFALLLVVLIARPRGLLGARRA